MKKFILSLTLAALLATPLLAEEKAKGDTQKFAPKETAAAVLLDTQKLQASPIYTALLEQGKAMNPAMTDPKGDLEKKVTESLGVNAKDIIEVGVYLIPNKAAAAPVAADPNAAPAAPAKPNVIVVMQATGLDPAKTKEILLKEIMESGTVAPEEVKYKDSTYLKSPNDPGCLHLRKDYLVIANNDETMKKVLDTIAGGDSIAKNEALQAMLKTVSDKTLAMAGVATPEISEMLKNNPQFASLKSAAASLNFSDKLELAVSMDLGKQECAGGFAIMTNMVLGQLITQLPPQAAQIKTILGTLKVENKQATALVTIEASATKENITGLGQELPILFMMMMAPGIPANQPDMDPENNLGDVDDNDLK